MARLRSHRRSRSKDPRHRRLANLQNYIHLICIHPTQFHNYPHHNTPPAPIAAISRAPAPVVADVDAGLEDADVGGLIAAGAGGLS